MTKRGATTGLAVMLIALAVVACAGPPPAGYEFPRHRGFGFGGPTALLDGVLEVRDGCLYVRSENGYATYVVWPAGYSLRVDGDSVAVYDGWSLRYRPGDRVTEGGGWYDDTTFVKERLVEGTLPAACPTDEYMMSTGHFEPPHP